MATRTGWSPGPASWKDDITPIAAADWNDDRAAHLLAMRGSAARPPRSRNWRTPDSSAAVRSLVNYESIPNPKMQPFVESGLWDPR